MDPGPLLWLAWTTAFATSILVFNAVKCAKKQSKPAGAPRSQTSVSKPISQNSTPSQIAKKDPNNNPNNPKANNKKPADPTKPDGKGGAGGKKKTEDEEFIPDKDYGDVAEPTASAKERREKQLAKEKADKIKSGFYRSKSDDDDTLEPIKSLKVEKTEDESTKKKQQPKKEA